MKLLFVVLSCFFLLTACSNGDQPAVKPLSRNSDTVFNTIAHEFIHGYLGWWPQWAVKLGLHEFDGKISDCSRASLNSQLAWLREYDQRLDAIDTISLSVKSFYDLRILRLAIRSEIINLDDFNTYAVNPIEYASLIDVDLYLKRNYAPLEKRLQYIIAVEKQFPSVFAAAKINLNDSLARPFIETAIDVCEGNASFLREDLLKALTEIKDDSLMRAFKQVNDTALAAIQRFKIWLKEEKLPKASNHYAIGEKNYRKMLLYNEGIQLPPEKILEIGLEELKKEQARFNAAASIINPAAKPIDVYHTMQQKEHPTADSLLPVGQKRLERIRQFLVDKDIVTIPSAVRVQVKERPPYSRSLGTASMDEPGPFEQTTEAYYYITPVNPKWTAKQKQDWLARFNYYTTDNVSIHEAYPGHYVQHLHLNASAATELEKVINGYAFTEGWAHYTELMMIEEGFGNNGDPVTAAKYRLAQSGDALLRICRLCVSVKMHCQGMTVADATKFFMDNWHQGEKPCQREAIRGTFDPAYLFYTLGKLEILKLREDYKKQDGSNYSLKKFNDAMLDNGMPPIGLLREVLLKDKSKWPEVL